MHHAGVDEDRVKGEQAGGMGAQAVAKACGRIGGKLKRGKGLQRVPLKQEVWPDVHLSEMQLSPDNRQGIARHLLEVLSL